jgi:three-Cys-motif partner protein
VSTATFFAKPNEASELKARLVAKYFRAWAKVALSVVKKQPRGEIWYVDLFSGPGRYEDGTKSTPLLVLEKAIADEDIRRRLVTIFNDADVGRSESLRAAIQSLPGIERLRNAPVVSNEEVGEDMVRGFETTRLPPTLFFIDPWGYKGLSSRLVAAALKNWGCDCIFFFNFNRVNMCMGNRRVEARMDALFGPERAKQLRPRLRLMRSQDREEAIVRELHEALREVGGEYVRPFTFRTEHSSRTRHHLILVTKHRRGYQIMKDIMAGESSDSERGVPSYQHRP